MLFFFVEQKTAYEMLISDWSSDVCSSDLELVDPRLELHHLREVRLVDAQFLLVLGVQFGPLLVEALNSRVLQHFREAHQGRRARLTPFFLGGEIGSASCRERVFHYV